VTKAIFSWNTSCEALNPNSSNNKLQIDGSSNHKPNIPFPHEDHDLETDNLGIMDYAQYQQASCD